jgi:hypothetical protein
MFLYFLSASAGPLPAFLASLPALQYVAFANNQLEGPLPEAWCNGGWWLVDVKENKGVLLPLCMRCCPIFFFS